MQDSSAFKKIQYHSKVNPHNMYNDASNTSLRYNKIHNLYLSSNHFLESYNYGTFRQQGSSTLNSNSYGNLGFEKKALAKVMDYNFNTDTNMSPQPLANSITFNNSSPEFGSLYNNVSANSLTTLHTSSIAEELVNPNNKYALGLTTDSKYYSNPFKYYGASNNT